MDALTITKIITTPDASWPDRFCVWIPDAAWLKVSSVTKAQLKLREATDMIVARGYDVFTQRDPATRATRVEAIRHNRKTPS